MQHVFARNCPATSPFPPLLSRFSPLFIVSPAPPHGEKRMKLCEENQYVSGRALERANALASAIIQSSRTHVSYSFQFISQHLVAAARST
jgi:hypothetical protein